MINCVLFNALFVYRTLNTNKKYRNSCTRQVGPGYQKSRIEVSQVLMTFNYQRWGPKQDPPGRIFGGFTIHKLQKIVGGEGGKRKYPARMCKLFAAHKKQSETKNIRKFCDVTLHKGSCFEKYHSVTNYQIIYIQFLKSQAQEHNLQCQTVSKNMLQG